jgi:phosphate transport system protein
MSKHLERDLQNLERQLLTQASVVEGMIRTASRALCQRQADLVWEVIKQEQQVNAREVLIEEECLKILALHQPVAIDLRRTAAVLKINGDLERIADLAVNLGERVRALAEQPDIHLSENLEKMATISVEMVRGALDAFVEFDADAAEKVCLRDNEVDDLNLKLIEELHEVMRTRSDLVEAALYFFSATRHIERIADHATNIAEDVIYLVEGEIARHRHEEIRQDKSAR